MNEFLNSAPPFAAVDVAPRPIDWRGSGRVLVVDDDDPVRFVVTGAVTRLGFTTQSASDGPTALSLFESDPSGYSLVILDVRLPSMNGIEVMRRLRVIRPDIPVIMMSGYSKQEAMERSPSEMANGFLHKPFKLDALAREVRAVLEH
jgi:CheY-like chemotaxis protein